MAANIQTVSSGGSGQALDSAVRTRYLADYVRGARYARLYDQLSSPVGQDMSRLARGSSVTLNFLGDMEPGTAEISEVVDITPQVLQDSTTTITPSSRAEALQSSELLMLQAYTNYGSERFYALGKNMMETVDLQAQAAALKGDIVLRDAARASLDAGSSGHRADDSLFRDAHTTLVTLKTPGWEMEGSPNWAAIMHPAVWHDLREGGNVVDTAKYSRAEILLRWELGSLGVFRLVVSPWAKVFGGAGADNADVVAATLSSSVSALDKTMTVSTVTHLDAMSQKWLTIGTEETDSTHYATNERVMFISHATGVVSFVGEGSNGGLRFDHAAGTAVRNADSVYTIVFGGPQSIAKVYQPSIGEYGEVIGPERTGLAKQFVSMAWKWYGGYGLISQNRILRAEVSSSADE